MKLRLILPLMASSFVLCSAHATLLGMYDPFDRSTATDVRYAVWDSFNETVAGGSGNTTTYTYSGIAGTSTLTGLSLNQNLAHINTTTGGGAAQGAGLLNGGDVYYSSTKAQSWILNATTSVDVVEMSFQVKSANVFDNSVPPNLIQVFLPTLDGVGAASFVQSVGTGETLFGFPVYVLEYRWTGLDIDAGSNLNITFALAGGNSGNFTRKPIDFVALDVSSSPIPEPSTWALLGLGLMLGTWTLRHRGLARG